MSMDGYILVCQQLRLRTNYLKKIFLFETINLHSLGTGGPIVWISIS